MGESTIRARASVPITVTDHESSCNFAITDTRKRKTTKSRSRRPKIHESVFRRIRNHAHAYAPIGLPAVYDVVKADGEIVTPDQYGLRRPNRCGQRKRRGRCRNTSGTKSGNDASSISLPSAPPLWLLAVSVDRAAPRAPTNSRARSDGSRTSFASSAAFLPGFASTWVDGYARAPFSFLAAGWPGRVLQSVGNANSIPHRESAWVRSGEKRRQRRRACPMTWIYRSSQQQALHRTFTRDLKRSDGRRRSLRCCSSISGWPW